MIKNCRILIPYSDSLTMEESLLQELAKYNLTIEQIMITGYQQYSANSHYGNWVFVPALDIQELHNTSLSLDLQGFILENNDIAQFTVGDKVKIQTENMLCGTSYLEGTVYRIFEQGSGIEILKKGTRSGKGWRFYPGDNCKIEKK